MKVDIPKGLKRWVFHHRLMAHWPEWRKDCTRSLHDFRYTPFGGRYRKPWHQMWAYWYRRGCPSGPPTLLSIMRRRRADQTTGDA